MTRGVKPLRLVVWGLGRHAIRKILPAVAETEGIELYGVCSRNRTVVTTCAERWACRGWTESALMLRDPNVDIVYVATPIALHSEHGARVLDAGKHLWCEKPLTSSLAQTLALVETSRRLGLSLCEGHMYLHHPQFQQLSKYLSEGRLGPIKSIECRFGIPRLEDPGFRSDPAMGGGALFDVGCYPVSAINALYPDATACIASARVCSGDGTGIDTDGYAVLELSNGVLAVLEWRRNSAYRNEISVWGDEGSLFTDKIFSKPSTYSPSFAFRDTEGREVTEEGRADNHFELMLKNFRQRIDDPLAVEEERRRITWRAEVVEQIWHTSGTLVDRPRRRNVNEGLC